MNEPRAGRLAGRLQAARLRAFVGRKEELAAFDEALGGGGVLFVHGPGGVGKSALLTCFAQRAVEAGRAVTVLDGRLLTQSTFLSETTSLFADEHAVLLVDAFERVQDLESWFRERFLPTLPEGALVVVAGRTPPDMTWRADPGWAGMVRVIELGDLDPMDADALLESRGVAGDLRDQLLSFAGGHPLALSLAAAGGRWTPAREVITALLDRLVGDVPDQAHRRALEVCAHTYRATEDLLRAVLPDDDAAALFAWLRRLPFIESSPSGLHPHHVVREIVEADLRWRDPLGHADLHQRLEAHLTERIHTAADADVPWAVGSLCYLHHAWRDAVEVHEHVLRPEDTDELLRLAAEQGEEAVAAHWMTKQPEAFRLYRSTEDGELAGASAWLRFTGDAHISPASGSAAGSAASDADPVVAAAWAHASANAPLRPGEHLAVYRSWVRAHHGGTSPVTSLMRWRAVAWSLRSERLAWSFAPGRPACDWRTVPPQARLEWLLSDQPPPERAPELAVLSQQEFTDAVRKALRHLSRHGELAANPLTRTRLLAGHPDPAHALRELLENAIRTLGHDPRATKPHRALEVTYLRATPTQEAAAERLGLSFSTYRRHLMTGIEQITKTLWHQELTTP